jgi:hypothetical protein
MMTKEEFKGFSSAAQHDMVLEALVRITKNLETMEKESGKPFAGTSKQRRNDIKLMTILAEAFSKNELVWEQKPRVTVDAGKYVPRDKVVVVGVGMERYNNKSMAELVKATDDESIYPVKTIAKSIDNSGISRNVVEGFKKVSNDRMAKRRSK